MATRQVLISPGTRGAFRSLMTSSTVNKIATAFQDEGFAPSPDCQYEDSSVRRVTTQEHMDSVDWTNLDHIARVLRVFERLLLDVRPDPGRSYVEWDQFVRAMKRDGYDVGTDGTITATHDHASLLPSGSLARLRDPTAIEEHLHRIRGAVERDPALAVGSAKELIESTAKVVLVERGIAWDDRDDVPSLIRKAQQALALHPSNAAPGPDGSDAVKRILGGISSVALGLAELRNRGYGTGHGTAGRRVGLGQRHGRLAVNAAVTWCELMLDTLHDARAPWRLASESE